MAEKGTISIHAQNIMPIIKKWLYSDKDIFVRELTSNACDAIAKYKMIVASGNGAIGTPVESDDYRVDIAINKDAGTLSFSDNGIGMTGDEVERYITQVAFSGAEEFLSKYKNDDAEGGIIGHFGLGFYSSFMVSSKVTIDTLSYLPDAQAVRWTSDDGMEYDLSDSERETRGTTVTLTLSEDEREFLDAHRLREVLKKYCAFMASPIFLHIDAEKEEQVNETTPLWLKKPADVTDDEYKAFYRDVFNDYTEPLFWIHLNAEYPFNLKGILYFPRLKNEMGPNEGQIKLFSGQVFVADNIKEVIPEFLMLLKGVIDCPELPLNVSRSFLQNDGYVKKISAYITRKVADRLVSEFTTKREDYQKYWDDIHPFVKYGCIRDDKFYERVKGALLLKTTKGEYMTLEEYAAKSSKTVYYASNVAAQKQLINLYESQGIDVVVLDTMIDNNFISFLEYSGKNESAFKRIDADTEGLTQEDAEKDEAAAEKLQTLFRNALKQDELEVKLASFKSDALPAMIVVDEQSRRLTEMSKQWGGGFNMPEKKTLTLNAENSLVRSLMDAENSEKTDLTAQQIFDLAELSREGLTPEKLEAFIERSIRMLGMV